MSTKKQSGLGRNAFFKNTTEDEQAPSAPESTPAAKKPEKVRTTLTLDPETLASMEMLKIEGRKTGERVTLSDVLNEAVTTLMQKKGLSL